MADIAYFEQVFDTIHYPAGEPHIQLKAGYSNGTKLPDHIIMADVRDFNGIGLLLTAHEILQGYENDVQWLMPYFPFARHDRRNNFDDGLELHTAMKMLRGSGILLAIIDPHSDVTGHITHYTQASVVDEYIAQGFLDNHPVIAIPDAGAIKKADSWVGRIHAQAGYTPEVIQCLKKRDVLTGKLSGFTALTEPLGGKPVIIVDDICDGGGTFMGLADELIAKGAGDLSLAVTHGLFTKGTDILRDVFENIYTLDCYYTGLPDGVDYAYITNIIERATPI